MPLSRPLRFFALMIFPTIVACAQQQDPSSEAIPSSPAVTLSVNVQVVGLYALVRDRKGELVHGLTQSDFALMVDGKPQVIRYFAEDNDLPLTIGLMVDTSGSQRQYFAEQRVASSTFLRSMLTRPQDNAFIMRFDTNVLLLQHITTSLPDLESALGKLPLTYPVRFGPGGGTLLFDAICGTARNAFRAEHRRRAVVILTDGEDNGSIKTRDDAVDCAQRYDVTIYTALYSSRGDIEDERSDPRVHVAPRDHLPGRTNMERVSRATGGRVFVVSKRLPIEIIYAQIERDLRRQYRLGFTPPAALPGSYHELLLKPIDKHQKLQTRIGYFTPSQQP